MPRRRRHVEALSPEVRLNRIARILAGAVLTKFRKDGSEGGQRGGRPSGADRKDKPREDLVRDGGNP